MKKTVKKIPGFRSGVWWKKILATLVYVLFFIFTLLALVQSILFAGLSFTFFIVALIFLFDLENIWLRLRLPRHDPILKYFLIFLFVLITISFWYALLPAGFFTQSLDTMHSWVGIPQRITPAPFDFPGTH